jgi:hypothetical protein
VRGRVFLIVGLALLAAALGGIARPTRAATTIFVDFHASGAGDGTSWANAYPDLSLALAAANSGDQVWVARGVYRPAGILRTGSFVLESGVAVYGGFGGFETSLERRDPATNVTTLSGNIGVQADPTDNTYHVVQSGTADASARLDGFRIVGGYANGGGANDEGGGLRITSNPSLSNLIIEDNFAVRGGGIYVASGTAALTGLAVRGNRSQAEGGGIYVDEATLAITASTFASNNAGQQGGGVYLYDGATTIANSVATGNRSVGNGGGIYSGIGSPTITNTTVSGNRAFAGAGFFDAAGKPAISNSTFVANSAEGPGGGLHFSNSSAATLTNVTITANGADDGAGLNNFQSTLTITNVTIARNVASVEGGGIDNAGGTTTLRDSILWQNTPDELNEGAIGDDLVAENNLIQGGCPDEVDCAGTILEGNPKLAALASNGGPTKTHALGAGSAAIDVGTAAICTANPKDQRGVARPIDGNKDGTKACDFGAFESDPAPPVVGFAAAASNGPESDTSVAIQVKLSTSAVGPVTVKYKVSAGTAKSPGDFTAASGTLTIPAMAPTRNITVSVVDDAFREPKETVVLEILSATGASVGKATHVYTIENDDPRAYCRGRAPTIIGTPGDDTIEGTVGPDIIVALGGDDTINGGRADDLICGGPGNDTIAGGPGNDTLRGEAGNDTLQGERGIDVLFGAAGADRLAGGPTTGDSCNGGPGVDSLLPDAGCESKAGVP